MRNRLIVAAALVAGCLTGLGLRSGPPVAAQEAAKRPLGQYAAFYHTDLMAVGQDTVGKNLSKLGEDGWELVAVAPGVTDGSRGGVTNQTVYFLKRPKLPARGGGRRPISFHFGPSHFTTSFHRKTP